MVGWPANERYGMEPAPGCLAFVHELLNTLSAGRPNQPDLLAGLPSAQDWADRALATWSTGADCRAQQVVLDQDDVEHLRRFRDNLHERITAGGTVDYAGMGHTASASLRLEEDGKVRLAPRGTGWRYLASLTLATALEAQVAEIWCRLKTCRNQECGITFYDRSRNNSGVWHDVRTCGNAANLRAHRARRRGELLA
ncbi:CGNR zinc finger domain-containing protein [Streptomyces rubiginosohelvolus]